MQRRRAKRAVAANRRRRRGRRKFNPSRVKSANILGWWEARNGIAAHEVGHHSALARAGLPASPYVAELSARNVEGCEVTHATIHAYPPTESRIRAVMHGFERCR